MKRSDMLLKLQEILIEAPEGIADAADSILTRLEQLGMAPPYSDAVFQKNAKVYIDANGREWESEDTIVLSEADAELFLKALENPPKPNQALIEANEEYRRRVRDDRAIKEEDKELDHIGEKE